MANSLLLIAFILVATATIGSCQLLTNINQARIRGTRLTCSNPSPFPFRPILSGATVSVSCYGGSATTTTDATGSFTLILNLSPPVTVLNVILGCRVIITLPANCNISFLFQQITTLQSALLVLESVGPGSTGQFVVPYFTA